MRTQRMSQQPEFTTPTLPASPPPTPGPGFRLASGVGTGMQASQRGWLFFWVFMRLLIGDILLFVPWIRIFWDKNPLFGLFPALGIFAAHGAVRGIVSGVGLLNLWIAFDDAIWHRDG